MGINNISGIRTTRVDILGSSDTFNILKNARIVVNDYAIYETNSFSHDNNINIFGTIQSNSYAVYSAGDNVDIEIGKTGRLVGSYGIYAFGDNAVIRNDGDIFAAQNYGIYSGASTAARLTNNGEISAYYGIYANGAGSVITNGADAEIDASYYGIYSSASAGTTRIANHGEVIVSEIGYAIYTGGANDRIVNDGRITGQVLLSDGNDSLDNRGGSISGPIYGGAGNDTLIVDKAAFKLTEISGEGEDTVKSTVSYTLSDFVERLILLGNKDIDGSGSAEGDQLDGNAGDNTLRGKAGIDNLFGHKGNDVLTGGADQDEFFFKGDGIDTVTDFHNGEDKIALPDFAGINTFAQLSSHIEKHGGDVWIELGGGDRLVLLHVVKTDLDATDFDFAI